MEIYEALNWIKEAEYTPCGYIIFNENKPEGQMKGKALKTIFEAAKNDELVPVELFNKVKKERDNLEKLKQEIEAVRQGKELSEVVSEHYRRGREDERLIQKGELMQSFNPD